MRGALILVCVPKLRLCVKVKEMATQSSFLSWEIPWTEEPARIQSMGSQTESTQLDATEQLNSKGRGTLILIWVPKLRISVKVLKCSMTSRHGERNEKAE